MEVGERVEEDADSMGLGEGWRQSKTMTLYISRERLRVCLVARFKPNIPISTEISSNLGVW
jgi:hypothetical protein